ncbi:MAG: BrnA antitoxin family protein [Burkholderiales bacterium]
MDRRRKPARTDADNPAWTPKDFARARPVREVVPAGLAAVLPRRRPGERGPQKAPTKIAVSIRLDREIVAYYRATGAGWQTRINEELARAIVRRGRGKRAA